MIHIDHYQTGFACHWCEITVYPKKDAHGFVVLCYVVVVQSFIMNSHEVLIHIHQGCFAGTGAIVRLPQCQWSEPDGKISQCITTTEHSKAKTVCIFLGIYCTWVSWRFNSTVTPMSDRQFTTGPVDLPKRWLVTRKELSCADVIINTSWGLCI